MNDEPQAARAQSFISPSYDYAAACHLARVRFEKSAAQKISNNTLVFFFLSRSLCIIELCSGKNRDAITPGN